MTNNKLSFAEEILELSFGYSIDAIWYNIESRRPNYSYPEKVEEFCYILEVAMKKGILRIANEGVFLEGNPENIAQIFKSSFPPHEEKMSDVLFCLDSNDNFWTPGGGVWICGDGDEVWT